MCSFWRKSSYHNDQTWKVIEAIARWLEHHLDWCVQQMPRRQWLFIVVVGTTPLSPSHVDRSSTVKGNAQLSRGQLFAPQETVWEPVRSPLIKKHPRRQQHREAYFHPQHSLLKLIDVAFQNARWRVKRINTAVSTQNVWRNVQDFVPGWMTLQVM